MTGAGSPVPGNVENPCCVRDLGHHSDGDQEDEDGTDPDRQVGQDRPRGARQRTVVSRTHGWPGRSGLVSVVSKRSATMRWRAFAVLA
jgi:hypothetical protein